MACSLALMANRYNPQNETSAVDDFTPYAFTEDQLQRVRIVMAEAAVRAGTEAELQDTLMMLGVWPGQEIEDFATSLAHFNDPNLSGNAI